MVEYDYVKTRREDVAEIKENQIPFVRFIMRWATKLNVAVFRASKGRLMNKFIGGYPVCIVTTTGAKSGKTRRIALIHLPHGDNKLLVASQGGMPKHPQWYHNLVANPDTQVHVTGRRNVPVSAHVATPEQRAELWPKLLDLYADFAKYQT